MNWTVSVVPPNLYTLPSTVVPKYGTRSNPLLQYPPGQRSCLSSRETPYKLKR
jgi:hypothetical protein